MAGRTADGTEKRSFAFGELYDAALGVSSRSQVAVEGALLFDLNRV